MVNYFPNVQKTLDSISSTVKERERVCRVAHTFNLSIRAEAGAGAGRSEFESPLRSEFSSRKGS